ncbi:Nn.00g117410.m01.CDS01 [Neocucurbitaria sp. VM-36]
MDRLMRPRRSAASQDLKVSALTKSVHTRLPREVRDMIYAYLLTPHDIYIISQCSELRLDKFPYLRGSEPAEFQSKDTEKPSKPRYIDPERTYVPSAVEIIQLVYERYHDFWIDMPSKIPAFLATDFFSVNCAPRNARLSKVHISGLLDSGQRTSINLETLALDFKALLDCTWAPTFDVDIAFRTDFGVSNYDAASIPPLANRMHTTWQTLKPWIKEAEKRGAKVYCILLTKATMYKYMRGEHNMYDTEEEWRNALENTLGGFWILGGVWVRMCWLFLELAWLLMLL